MYCSQSMISAAKIHLYHYNIYICSSLPPLSPPKPCLSPSSLFAYRLVTATSTCHLPNDHIHPYTQDMMKRVSGGREPCNVVSGAVKLAPTAAFSKRVPVYARMGYPLVIEASSSENHLECTINGKTAALPKRMMISRIPLQTWHHTSAKWVGVGCT